jgi:hypothetical protein
MQKKFGCPRHTNLKKFNTENKVGITVLVPQCRYHIARNAVLAPQSWCNSVGTAVLVPHCWCHTVGATVFVLFCLHITEYDQKGVQTFLGHRGVKYPNTGLTKRW